MRIDFDDDIDDDIAEAFVKKIAASTGIVGVYDNLGDPGTVCCYCDEPEGEIEWESSRTAYHWKGEGLDPNRPRPMCRRCAAEHHDHWDEMWSYANGGY